MRYQIICYVPDSHVEAVKQAMFSAGAGRFSGYSQCCWQSVGQGQFMPESDASPFTGSVGKLEQVREIKLELFCEGDYIAGVIAAIKQAHPYEVPAYAVFTHDQTHDKEYVS